MAFYHPLGGAGFLPTVAVAEELANIDPGVRAAGDCGVSFLPWL
jgi:hypothetical protein